jgi:hypothetical protein
LYRASVTRLGNGNLLAKISCEQGAHVSERMHGSGNSEARTSVEVVISANWAPTTSAAINSVGVANSASVWRQPRA